MKAVVLAGGKGARLAPYTKILPKPLVPIHDMPILEILLRQLARQGIEDVYLTVNHLAELLWAFFQDGAHFGLRIHYSFEEEPLGTAGPLSLVSDQLDETFLVTNGDVLTSLDFQALASAHQQSGAAVTIAMYTRKVNIDFGVLELGDDNQLTNYVEKPSYEFPVSMGIYVFEPRALEYIPHGEYLDFPDLVLKLIAANEKVNGFPFAGYWRDLGRASDYEQAVDEFITIRKEILGEAAGDPKRLRPRLDQWKQSGPVAGISKPR
jgi:NDP-sugar pyrophosphorylase family protein